MPSMRIWPAACAGPCTVRPASGWRMPGHQPCRSPSTWPAGRLRVIRRRSPDIAADLLDRAVGLMSPGDPGRDGLLAERASSLMWAGRIADAQATCRLLLGRDLDPSLEDTVRVCLGYALLAGGQARDGLCELERAFQSPLLTGAERAE